MLVFVLKLYIHYFNTEYHYIGLPKVMAPALCLACFIGGELKLHGEIKSESFVGEDKAFDDLPLELRARTWVE